MEKNVGQAPKFKKSYVSTVMEKKLTDSYAEMPSSLSLLPVMLPAPRTVHSACGLRGPPALTPAQGKLQRESRSVHAPSWPMRVRKVVFSVQIAVLCKKYAAAMIIPVLYITGRLVRGVSALKTLRFHPSTQLQLGMGKLLVLSACKQGKSSV